MESLNSLQSSDSENSILNYHHDYRQSSSTNSLIALTQKNLCPTNILKFSNYLSSSHLVIIGLRRTHFPGSATATICVLNNRDLSALNLGDSGFLLIRYDAITNEPYLLIRSKE
jgi:serine/threonine protein phosphatase PrpC